MPTETERITLRRAIRLGQVAMDGGRVAVREHASENVRRLVQRANGNTIENPPTTRSWLLLEFARARIMSKYEEIGGHFSALGLAIDPGMPVRMNGETAFVEFRGGRIETTNGGDPIAWSERKLRVIWTALECLARQEGEDEVYGTVGGINTQNGALKVTHFPESGGYWSLGAPGMRVILPNATVYEGSPDHIVISATLIENDSGDIDAAKQKIAAKLAEAGQALGGMAGVPAETFASDQGWTSDLSLGLVNAISDALGAADDPYVPQTLRLAWPDILGGNYARMEGRRGDDPRVWDYTHSIVLSGTDEGGDVGHYRFYFKVELETITREIAGPA